MIKSPRPPTPRLLSSLAQRLALDNDNALITSPRPLLLAPSHLSLNAWQAVRSTQRLMAGAAMFARADLDVIASHGAEGPPLATFLFPLPVDVDELLRFETYATKVGEAFLELLKAFPGLSWDNRLLVNVLLAMQLAPPPLSLSPLRFTRSPHSPCTPISDSGARRRLPAVVDPAPRSGASACASECRRWSPL